MKKKNGVYIIDVVFKVGKKMIKGEIVIDSGAAECVMPYEMLAGLEVLPKEKGVKFTAANGKELGSYGRKLVEFVTDGSHMMVVDAAGFTRRA
jgi:hypothetical protein